MANYGAFVDYDHDDRYDNNDWPTLSMGERIVWISDNGPEYGNVRWLGKLPDIGREWMAGVEFDNPVGSGTGLYKDRQLFVTKLNHASLVPIIGLLKASDFDEPAQASQPAKKKDSSSIRLIDINNSEPEQYHHNPVNHRKSPVNSSSANYHNHFDIQRNYHNNISNKISEYSQTQAQQPRSKQTSSRTRNIPIRLEGSETENSNSRSVTTKNSESSNKNSIKATTQAMDDLTSYIDKVHLNKKPQQQPQPSLPLLPAPPLLVASSEKNPNLTLKNLLGKSRGIQGHNNSCYLDATLFAMFSSTTLFDSLLYRPPNKCDIPEYSEIQRILREDIVRPLRDDFVVNADQVMLFRTMLEQSSSVEGLTDEEKDPEEFLSLLLSQILKAEPYLKLSSGLESFFYQLIVDKDEDVVLPTVQDLFEQSFMNSTVRLREIPPCLLLQMPRFGRQYKMYSRIMPSLKLDITDVLESAPRACGHRGKDCDNIAKYECKACFGERSGRSNARLSTITYCHSCFQTKHFGKSHSTGIEDHDKTKTLLDKTPSEATSRYSVKGSGGGGKDKEIPRINMDLFAVLCIETSHYVCFVKCGQSADSPWCFFDSMADRRGEQNGYNIPEVLLFDEFPFWTSENGVIYLLNNKDDKLLPEMARRLICDAYLCFYQYPGLATYR